MPNRYPSPSFTQALNRQGRGRLHMGSFAYPHQTYYDALRIPPLRELLELISKSRRKKIMSAGKGVIKQGVSTAASLVLTGTGNDWQFVDGLDAVMDMNADDFMIDWGLAISSTAGAGNLSIAFEIDGVINPSHITTVAKLAATPMQFNGSSWLQSGDGVHRIRLMMTSDAALTVTFQSRARYMRLISLAVPSGT